MKVLGGAAQKEKRKGLKVSLREHPHYSDKPGKERWGGGGGAGTWRVGPTGKVKLFGSTVGFLVETNEKM